MAFTTVRLTLESVDMLVALAPSGIKINFMILRDMRLSVNRKLQGPVYTATGHFLIRIESDIWIGLPFAPLLVICSKTSMVSCSSFNPSIERVKSDQDSRKPR